MSFQIAGLIPAGPGSAEGALLRAKAARRLGDYDAVHASATLAVRESRTIADRLAAAALQALAAKHQGKTAEARRLVGALENELAEASAEPGAEARTILALDALEEGDTERARALVDRNVRAGVREGESYALLGAIEAAAGRLDDGAAALLKAQRKANPGELQLEATIAASLATIAAESVDLELAKKLKDPFEGGWPGSLGAERFWFALSRRTIALLEGDTAAAFFAAREASAVAPDAASTALADVSGAVVSRILGDFASERLQYRRAWDTLRSLPPDTNASAASQALAAFAYEAAGVMPAEARKAMTAYRAAVARMATAEPAVEAIGLMGAARVAEIAGDRHAAVRAFERSLELWEESGAALRTALVAIELRRLTGDDAYAKTARAVASRAPKSWFAAELRRGRNPVARLTPAERVVLARLLRGESAKAIGKALGRSPYTISNHTRKIFAAFELNSRSKVIARCTELGITHEAVARET